MWQRQFWLDLAERAVKTFAQALLASIVVGKAITDYDWGGILAAAGIAAAISVLTSVVGSGVGASDSGSWLPQQVDPPQPTAQDAGSTIVGVLLFCVAVAVIVWLGATINWFWLLLLLAAVGLLVL